MSDLTASVTPGAAETLMFDVVVRGARGESRHRVTIEADERWTKLGAEPRRCIEAEMWFLLDREPKELILSAFDMRVIRRYFPQFDDVFAGYLARSGGSRGAAHSRHAQQGGLLS